MDLDLKAAGIARACHEANRAYCKSIGDDTQVPFDEAPRWQVDSAIQGVKAHLANPTMTAEQSHESWLAEKKRTGWKFGPVKDAERKEHPCFQPYADLPESQQRKDALFGACVEALR